MLHLLYRAAAALGLLLLTICVAEFAVAGVRLLLAERPRSAPRMEVPENFWSALREMEQQARAMGLR
ncbi:hypothetical protein BH24GEM1_BH24GEM1_29990 [soil metagenome]